MPTSRPMVGIMFDTLTSDDTPFPTLDRAVHYSCEDAEGFAGWLAVASDPNRLQYFDDDAQAMDETNWDVIVGALDEPAEYCNPRTAYSRGMVDIDMSEEISAAGYALYHDTFQTYLIVDPANEELLDTMIELRSNLEGYPMLDDDAYSEREMLAWNEWMLRGGLENDTLRELSSLDDDTAEAVSDAWAEVAPIACNYLHYWNGFSGEHGPDFSECVATAVGTALTRVLILT